MISGKTWVNNHAHILRFYFDNKYLLHYLNQFNFHGYVSGTTRLKLTQGSLRKIPIEIAPLPEQRAIVSKLEQLLSELDNGITNLKLAQEQLKVYRQAVLKKAFLGLNKILFSELLETSQNGIAKRSGKAGFDFKVLRLADIDDMTISYDNPRCIKLTSSEIQKYKLLKNDLACIRVNGSKI